MVIIINDNNLLIGAQLLNGSNYWAGGFLCLEFTDERQTWQRQQMFTGQVRKWDNWREKTRIPDAPYLTLYSDHMHLCSVGTKTIFPSSKHSVAEVTEPVMSRKRPLVQKRSMSAVQALPLLPFQRLSDYLLFSVLVLVFFFFFFCSISFLTFYSMLVAPFHISTWTRLLVSPHLAVPSSCLAMSSWTSYWTSLGLRFFLCDLCAQGWLGEHYPNTFKDPRKAGEGSGCEISWFIVSLYPGLLWWPLSWPVWASLLLWLCCPQVPWVQGNSWWNVCWAQWPGPGPSI